MENETDHKDYVIHGHSYEGGPIAPQSHSHSYETIEHQADYDGGSFSGSSEPKDLGHQFQDITVHHGHGQWTI